MQRQQSGTLALGALLLAGLAVGLLQCLPSDAPKFEPDDSLTQGIVDARTADRLATLADSAGGSRQVSLSSARIWLQVIDAADFDPLRDARVSVRSLTSDRTESPAFHEVMNTGPDGLVCLTKPFEGMLDIDIRCAAHASIRGNLQASALRTSKEGPCRFRMHRAGTVQVQIAAEDRPARNVRVALLPPTATRGFGKGWQRFAKAVGDIPARQWPPLAQVDGSFEMANEPVGIAGTWFVPAPVLAAVTDWVATTDRDGMAAWPNVLCRTGYRWGVLPPNHATVQPAHEDQRLKRATGGIAVGQAPPGNLSGLFETSSGEVTSWSASLLGRAVVHGRIDAPRGSRPLIKLCRLRQMGNNPAAGGDHVVPVTTLDIESWQRADVDGSFQFRDVRPGLFALRSCWRTGPRDVWFGGVTFRLQPEMTLDVGTIRASTGRDVRVRMELRCGTTTGVDPTTVFAPPGPGRAPITPTLAVVTRPDSDFAHEVIFEQMALPFGESFTLHGIPDGTIHLTPQAPLGAALRNNVVEVRAPKIEPVRVGREAMKTVALEVVRGRSVSVQFTAAHGVAARSAPPAFGLLHTRSRTTGRIESHELRGLDGRQTVTLADGDYEVFAMASVSNGNETTWVGHCNVHVSSELGTLAVPCRPGETRRGRAATATGQPIAHQALHWTLPAWRGKSSTRWLYTAHTDGKGQFELPGAPPGVTLHSDHATMHLGPGTAPALLSRPN